jgi:hypothetical protein
VKPTSRFCETCPLKLSKPPTEPCHKALERIYAEQGADKKTDMGALPGCPFAVNSAAHGYCFWKFAEELEDPISDREICTLLGINGAALDRTLQSALAKLKSLSGTEVLNDFIESAMEKVARQDPDHTVYLPDSYSQPVTPAEPEEDEDAKAVAEKPKKPRKGMGMPVHRSGDRVDIFGLYSRKKLEEMRKKK